MVIDQAEPETGQYGYAYFYCDHKHDDRNDPASILGSLVKQLCMGCADGSFLKLVYHVYQQRERDGDLGRELSVHESKLLLTDISAGFRQTTIVIDGLDECNGSKLGILLDFLEYLVCGAWASPIKLFVTSRNNLFIRAHFSKFPHFTIRSDDNFRDMRIFIDSKVEECIKRRELLGGYVTDNLKTDIKRFLRETAEGRSVSILSFPLITILNAVVSIGSIWLSRRFAKR